MMIPTIHAWDALRPREDLDQDYRDKCEARYKVIRMEMRDQQECERHDHRDDREESEHRIVLVATHDDSSIAGRLIYPQRDYV